MPPYYFNIRQPDGRLAVDEEGMDLAGFDAAMAEGVASARELAAEGYRSSGRLFAGRIEIKNAAGAVIAVLPIRTKASQGD